MASTNLSRHFTMRSPNSIEPQYFSALQSRRFACVRCHQHKLRCERTPVTVNSGVTLAVGSCKRCLRAKVPCHYNTNSKGRPSPPKAMEANDTGASSGPASSAGLEFISPEASGNGYNISIADDVSLTDLGDFDFRTGEYTVPGTSKRAWSTLTSTLALPSMVGGDNEAHVHDAPVQEELAHDRISLDLEMLGDEPLHQIGSPVSTPSIFPLPSSQSEYPHNNAATRDDCRKALLELHFTIFEDFHSITEADLADALFSPDCTSLLGTEDVLGKLASASERLIELLGMMRVVYTTSQPAHIGCATSAGTRPSSIAYSPRRYHGHSASSTSSFSQQLRQSPHPARFSKHASHFSSNNSSSVVNSFASPLSSSSSSIDLPFIISFFTCYAGLLSVYRNVLMHILHLSSPEQLSERDNGPITGTPESSSRSSSSSSVQNVLRIRIHVEVLAHVMERMEDSWVAAATDSSGCCEGEQLDRHRRRPYYHHQQQERRGKGSRGSMFGRPETFKLLQSILAHEGFMCGVEEEWRGGQVILMGLLREIRISLRGSNPSTTHVIH